MKPLILVTNDDGIDSRGIRHLVEIMNHFGEVVLLRLIVLNLEWVMQLLLEIN